MLKYYRMTVVGYRFRHVYCDINKKWGAVGRNSVLGTR